MKGADQCPKCASRRWAEADQAITKFYAATLRVCVNCGTTWEPFDPADLLDQCDPKSSFTEPCNNCAFRSDSPEQADRERWTRLIADLKAGAGFFCHKGVPLDVGSEDGFAYPRDGEGKPAVLKLRLCRGYLKMLNKQLGGME